MTDLVEAHRGPSDGLYRERRILRAGETLTPSTFPDVVIPIETLIRR